MMVWVVPIPVWMILVILVVLYVVVVQHFWLFMLTVAPVAAIAILLVRRCWDWQDRRREARDLARVQRSFSKGRES